MSIWDEYGRGGWFESGNVATLSSGGSDGLTSLVESFVGLSLWVWVNSTLGEEISFIFVLVSLCISLSLLSCADSYVSEIIGDLSLN